jgi:hypothetical protein
VHSRFCGIAAWTVLARPVPYVNLHVVAFRELSKSTSDVMSPELLRFAISFNGVLASQAVTEILQLLVRFVGVGLCGSGLVWGGRSNAPRI